METFDLESLTWDELAMVEGQAVTMGKDENGEPKEIPIPLGRLLKLSAYRQAVAAMVLASRNGADVPSWKSLMSRRVLDASSSPSQSDQDSPSARSDASE